MPCQIPTEVEEFSFCLPTGRFASIGEAFLARTHYVLQEAMYKSQRSHAHKSYTSCLKAD